MIETENQRARDFAS